MEEGKLGKIKKFFQERKYVLLLLLWVVFIVWYFLMNKVDKNLHLIHIPIDDKIPFVEFFVIFYVLWYGYIAFSFIWTLVTSKRDFLTMCSLVFLTYLTSLIVITVYPSYHDLRPDPSTVRDNLFTKLVFALYSTEEPRCIFPSMHCMGVLAMSVGLLFAESLKGKLWPKIFCPIFSVLVMLSTVFIKQHSFADVLLAIGMIIPVCLLTYFVIVPKRRFAPNVRPQQEEPPSLQEEIAAMAEQLPEEETELSDPVDPRS